MKLISSFLKNLALGESNLEQLGSIDQKDHFNWKKGHQIFMLSNGNKVRRFPLDILLLSRRKHAFEYAETLQNAGVCQSI